MKNDDSAQDKWAILNIDTAAFLGLICGILLHLFVLFIALATPVHAFVGDFVTNPKTLNVGSGSAQVVDIVQNQDTSLIVASSCNAQASLDRCFTRLNVFGSVDTTWGTENSGSVIETTPAQDLLSGVAATGDGGRYAFGACAGSACIIKYLPNGARDSMFAAGGKKTMGGSVVHDLKLQNDGRVVYTSECYQSSVLVSCVGRLLLNGNFDPAFNGGQERTIIPGALNQSSTYVMTSIALDPYSNSIYLTGPCRESATYEFCVVRLNASGAPETFWANNGWTRFSMAGIEDIAQQVLVRPDQTILVIGRCRTDQVDTVRTAICVAQLLSYVAVPDNSFGDNGRRFVSPVPSGTNRVYSRAAFLLGDGSLGIVGECWNALTVSKTCLAMLASNGTDDKRLPGYRATIDLTTTPGHRSQLSGAGALIRRIGNGVAFHAFSSCGPSDGSNDKPCIGLIEWACPRGGWCTPDLDGDGKLLATTDGILLARTAAGVRGTGVTTGATGLGGIRQAWESIHELLARECGIRVAP